MNLSIELALLIGGLVSIILGLILTSNLWQLYRLAIRLLPIKLTLKKAKVEEPEEVESHPDIPAPENEPSTKQEHTETTEQEERIYTAKEAGRKFTEGYTEGFDQGYETGYIAGRTAKSTSRRTITGIILQIIGAVSTVTSILSFLGIHF